VPNLGVSELLVIFLMLLLVFGGSRLPSLGESLGKTLRGFKRGMSSDERIQVVASGDKKDAAASASNVPASPAKSDATDAELVDKS